MAAYVDYTFYDATYKGIAIPEASFARIALRAADILDRLSFQRVEDDTDNTVAIQNASCAIADIFYNIEQSGASGLKSEKTGQTTQTYMDRSEKARPPMQRYTDAAQMYLSDTTLLYRGFLANEYGSTEDAD